MNNILFAAPSNDHLWSKRALELAVSLFMAFSFMSPVSAQSAGTDYAQQLPVRGVVRSSAEAVISTDLIARITKIQFKEGERFDKGELLVSLDCRQLKAELSSAEAQLREMKVALKSTSYLFKKNASSRQDIETARARSDRAAAEAEVIRAQVDRCDIMAPYNGRVSEQGMHEHEMSAPGKPLLSIVAEREPKMELIVPSTWLLWLKVGSRFQFHVDETGREHGGEITRLGAAVDTVSQTIKVFAKFTKPAPGILPGMSGTAEFRNKGLGGS